MFSVVLHGAWQAARWRHREMAPAAAATTCVLLAALALASVTRDLRAPLVVDVAIDLAILAIVTAAWSVTVTATILAAARAGKRTRWMEHAAHRGRAISMATLQLLWPAAAALLAGSLGGLTMLLALSLPAAAWALAQMPTLIAMVGVAALGDHDAAPLATARTLTDGRRLLAGSTALLMAAVLVLPMVAGMQLGRLLPEGLGQLTALIIGTPAAMLACGMAASLHLVLSRLHDGTPLDAPIFDHVGTPMSVAPTVGVPAAGVPEAGAAAAEGVLADQVVEGTVLPGQPLSAWIGLRAAGGTSLQLAWSAGPTPNLLVCDQTGQPLPLSALDATGMAIVNAPGPGWYAAHVITTGQHPQQVRLLVMGAR